MYFFSHHGLKNLKILNDFLVLKSPFACSFQKIAMVVSFAEVANAPTINLLFSECSSWSCKNFQICFNKGSAVFFVLSVTFSSLGVRNGAISLALSLSLSLSLSLLSQAIYHQFQLFLRTCHIFPWACRNECRQRTSNPVGEISIIHATSNNLKGSMLFSCSSRIMSLMCRPLSFILYAF